ncbi:MAG: 2-oxoacid:acceptor oxidoreductase family protein [Promethearchaeota archaeon]
MTKRYEIRAIGYGGQGVITLSKMIVEAVVNFENKLAVQTEAYSASARGGKCWADVVIELDDKEKMIDYPQALSPYDFIFVLSNEATSTIKKKDLKKDGGWLVWDTSIIKKFRIAKKLPTLGIPVQEIAVKKFGNTIYGSTILFGVFCNLSGVISHKSAEKTIYSFVPLKTREINLKAFELGYEKAREFKNNFDDLKTSF